MHGENAELSAQRGTNGHSFELFILFKNPRSTVITIEWHLDLPNGFTIDLGSSLSGTTSLNRHEESTNRGIGIHLGNLPQTSIADAMGKEIVLNMTITADEFFSDSERATMLSMILDHERKIAASVMKL